MRGFGLILKIGFLISAQVEPSLAALSIEEFIKTSLNKDFSYKNLDLENQAQKLVFEGKDKRWSSRLGVSPLISDSKSNFNNYWGGSLSFSILGPTGTHLSVEHENLIDTSGLFSDANSYNSTLRIDQSLFKNAFGKQFKIEKEVEENKLRYTEIKYLNGKISSCLTSAIEFSKAYSLQEQLRIQKEIAIDAKKAFEIIKSAYEKSLISKIEFLTAKTDLFETQEQEILTRKKWYEQKIELSRRLNLDSIETILDLQDPSPYFLKLPFLKEIAIEKSPPYLEVQYQTKFLSHSYELAKQVEKSTLTAFAQISDSKEFPGTSAILPQTDQQIMVGLKMEWPFWDTQRRGRIQTALSEFLKSENSLKNTRRNLRSLLQNFVINYELGVEQLEIVKNRMKTLEIQMKESLRLLKVGRINFNDYIIFRDRWLTESLRQISLRSQTEIAKAEINKMQNIIPPSCEENSK